MKQQIEAKQLIKGDVKEGLIPIGAGIQIPINIRMLTRPYRYW